MHRKKILRMTFSVLVLFVSSLFAPICFAQGIQIPYIPDGWILDGAIDDETGIAAGLLHGSLPMQAWAMHDGQGLYFAFEVFSPEIETAPDEIFAVLENGDGIPYSVGDFLIRCFAEGCEIWRYVAQYQFEFASDLPSAAGPGSVETYISFTEGPIAIERGWPVFGNSFQIGLTKEGTEIGPWQVSYELEPIPGPEAEQPGDTPSPEPSAVIAEETEAPEQTIVPTEVVGDDTATRSGLPGWLLPGIAGGLLLAMLLAWLTRRKPK